MGGLKEKRIANQTLHALALCRPFLASHAYYDDVFSCKYTEMSREVSKFRKKTDACAIAGYQALLFSSRLPAREKRGTEDKAKLLE